MFCMCIAVTVELLSSAFCCEIVKLIRVSKHAVHCLCDAAVTA
jgi:hypothetical protein